MQKTVKEQIDELANQHLNGGPNFDFSKNIFDHYGADELDEIEILMSLEEHFNIEMQDIDYNTLDMFLQEVESKLKAKEE